jgi:hypothetical protein
MGGRFNGGGESRRRGGPGSLLTVYPYTGRGTGKQLEQVDQLPFVIRVSRAPSSPGERRQDLDHRALAEDY